MFKPLDKPVSIAKMASASERLNALFAADWQWEMLDNPEFASQAGEHDVAWAPDTVLQHVDRASYARRAAHSEAMAAAARALLSEDSLSKQEKIFASIFESQHADIVRAFDKAPLFLMPINSVGTGGAVYSFLESIEWMRLESEADLRILLNRVRACPAQLREFQACLADGMQSGYVASAAMLHGVAASLGELASGSGPFSELQPALASACMSPALRGDLDAAVVECRTAFGELLAFVAGPYMAAARASPACSDLPCGPVGYRECLQFHTTTAMTAQEVHSVGLAEVARIEARYRADVMVPLGLPDDFPAFVASVRVDPRFYVSSDQALLDVYRGICDNIRTRLPAMFSEFPSSPLEIVSTTKGPAAFYLAGTPDGKRPGRFYVNTANLSGKPIYEATALALHEAIPGHHHQVSLAMANADVPHVLRCMEDRRYEASPCRRQLYTAFCEGWALYCEYLGEEMGMYRTPYDIFGRLSMDMMRAVRLVVDTGLHSLGWSVDAAVSYMMEKTGMHEKEVTAEIRRYASWPGQACAYKIGQLEILRMRRRAEEALGSKFSLSEFHSLCLMSGPLTLALLADIVEEYIDRKLSSV